MRVSRAGSPFGHGEVGERGAHLERDGVEILGLDALNLVASAELFCARPVLALLLEELDASLAVVALLAEDGKDLVVAEEACALVERLEVRGADEARRRR